MGDHLLTVVEAANYLQISKCTVYRYAENNALPHIRKRFGLRFRRDDLDAWLERDKRNCLPSLETIAVDLGNPLRNAIVGRGGMSELSKTSKSKTRFNFGYGAVYIRKTKEGNPRFYIDYYDADKKRVQQLVRHATSMEEAEAALKQAVLNEYRKLQGVEVKNGKIGFKDFSRIYLQDYIMTARRNWQSDKYRLDKLNSYFADTDLREITPLMIERFRKSRLQAGNARSTTNRFLAGLKRLFSIAIQEGYAETNPVKAVKFFSEKDRLIERILSADEEARLLEVSSGHLRPILIMALNTGMRLGEILNLRWREIDLAAKIIRVEGAKSGRLRFIPINSALFEELVAWKSRNGQSPYVFPNNGTGKPYTLIRRSFLTACKKTEISGFRFHDTRHTFASRLIAKGVDIETVKSLLGHFSIVVTQRYIHSNEEAQKKAVEVLAPKPKETAPKEENLLHRRDTGKIVNLADFKAGVVNPS